MVLLGLPSSDNNNNNQLKRLSGHVIEKRLLCVQCRPGIIGQQINHHVMTVLVCSTVTDTYVAHNLAQLDFQVRLHLLNQQKLYMDHIRQATG